MVIFFLYLIFMAKIPEWVQFALCTHWKHLGETLSMHWLNEIACVREWRRGWKMLQWQLWNTNISSVHAFMIHTITHFQNLETKQLQLETYFCAKRMCFKYHNTHIYINGCFLFLYRIKLYLYTLYFCTSIPCTSHFWLMATLTGFSTYVRCSTNVHYRHPQWVSMVKQECKPRFLEP